MPLNSNISSCTLRLNLSIWRAHWQSLGPNWLHFQIILACGSRTASRNVIGGHKCKVSIYYCGYTLRNEEVWFFFNSLKLENLYVTSCHTSNWSPKSGLQDWNVKFHVLIFLWPFLVKKCHLSHFVHAILGWVHACILQFTMPNSNKPRI